jgi:glycine oxidase
MALRVSTADVAVVGGGVIGAACARAAAVRGLRVALFEPGPDPGAASPASAGMLAAQIESPPDAEVGLSVRARDLYAELAPALQDSTGIAIGLWRDGIATLALDEEGAEGLRREVGRQRQAGLRADWLEPDDVLERWPGAGPTCRGALFAPEDGALDPNALTRALLADARRLGATFIPERVERLGLEQGRAERVATGRETIAAHHIVVAAGAWSPLIPGVPRRLAVTPVRGQLVTTPWPSHMPAAILYHNHCYVLARGRDAVLGSTMEHAGFQVGVTNEGLAEIFRGTVALLPALATLPVQRMWAGLRPLTPDGRPIVGADPEVSGLWYATGHGRNGVLLAALTGEVIGDLLATGTTPVDISPWSVKRFSS